MFINRRSFLCQAGALTASGLWLDACSGKDPAPITPSLNTPIACYGDSLTDGFRGPKLSTPLAEVFPDRTIENYGISGQTAEQIAARQGGRPARLTLDGNAFAGASAVRVTGLSTRLLSTPDSNDPVTMSGTLGGVPCTIRRTATGIFPNQAETYSVSPLTATTQAIPANSPFYPDSGEKSKSYIQTLWIGRNNVPSLTGVDAILADCVSYLASPKRFVIIGVLNAVGENATVGTANYPAILAMNALLAKNYPANFVPSTPPTAAEMTSLTYKASAQDLNDIADGAIPRGMRSDGLHLNTAGCQLIASRIAGIINNNKW